MDAVGTNIRLDARMREVMRALPRVNEDVNEEWAKRQTRHAVDGLLRRRLDRPWIRVDGKLREASWNERSSGLPRSARGAGSSVPRSPAIWWMSKPCTRPATARRSGSDLIEGRQTGSPTTRPVSAP
jgi:NADH-quinone oxidoreductase subunit G